MSRMRFSLALASIAALCAAEDYKLGPDSQRQAGVPKGTVTQHRWTSKIFAGTVRDYWVYVPALYKPDKPAPVMIFQDGAGFVPEDGRFRVPVVFDNLIHKGDMPPTVAILINPGVLPALSPEHQERYDRSYEYDALGDRYARFLIEEILPEVGRKLNLSKDPNDRAIAGSSSGAIAAFTAAWNRPDAFRRVLSYIGSYTNLRGGNVYPALVRKTEPKPLRVYLQDGRNDQNIYSGHWFIGNQDLASALEYADYDFTFTVGTEGHNAIHGSAILPDALRWLWRDYPKPIAKPKGGGQRHYITEILGPDSEWELVSKGHRFTEGPAVDRQGNIFFADPPNNRIHRIGVDGQVSLFKENTGGASGLKFGPDGRLYACQTAARRIVAYTADGGQESPVATDVDPNDLTINAKGEIYFSDPRHSRVWFVDASGRTRAVIEGTIEFPNGLALSPDQSLLAVADTRSKWVWSYQVLPDGSLTNGQAFHRLETPDESSMSGADGVAVDSEGHVYVATRMGVQILDQPGRVVGIINKPHGGALSNLVFAGPEMKTLYVTAGDRVYRRPVTRTGVAAWTPVKPPKPRL